MITSNEIRNWLPLPPLPLIDGAFLIDNSGLELLRCPRLFYYQFLRRRVKADAKAGRNFGSTIHLAQAVRYREARNNPVDSTIQTMQEESMREWLASNPQPLEDFRNFNHACLVNRVYNEIYRAEPFRILTTPQGKPIVEASFMLPLGTIQNIPIFYTGKIDLAIEDNAGTWVQDTKTAFQFGETFDRQMQRDSGQKGYVWALSQILGRKPSGYIINAIRIRRAKRGQEYDPLASAPVDASDFKRIPFYVNEADLELWKINALEKIKLIFWFHDNAYFPEYEGQCTNKFGLCDMYDVCSLPVNSRENALASSIYEDNDWSPLNAINKTNQENKESEITK